MNAVLANFVEETCNSPYEAQRVCEVLGQIGVNDMVVLTAIQSSALSDRIRTLRLADELWVSIHAMRCHEAARVEAARTAKASRRVPSSSMRGKNCMDSVEDEVKRMRLQ